MSMRWHAPCNQPHRSRGVRRATAADDVFRVGFLPRIERTAGEADVVVATGETRERNLVLDRGRQAAILASLAAADAWLDTNPPPAAYRDGVVSTRAAMNEAQAGFLWTSRWPTAPASKPTPTIAGGLPSPRAGNLPRSPEIGIRY